MWEKLKFTKIRILIPLTLLWGLSVFDLILTLWAYYFTSIEEVNPIALSMLQNNRVGALVVFKVGMLILGSAIFWIFHYMKITEISVWVIVVIYAVVAMKWNNYTLYMMNA